MFLVIVLAFCALGAQLGNLQFRQGQYFAVTAQKESIRTLPQRAPRGVIYDRNGQRLADSRLAYSVYVNYEAFKNDALLRRLSQVLGRPYESIKKDVQQRQDLGQYLQPVLIKNDVTPEQYTYIAEHGEELRGVTIVPEPVRDYLSKDLTGLLLGYVHPATPEDVNSGHKPDDIVGQDGLEAYYDNRLRGKDGQVTVQVDALVRPVKTVSSTQPVRGQSLVLSVDTRIQNDTARALDYTMYKIRHRVDNDGTVYKNANRGAAIMMDVKTGEILSMVSLPGYDPNAFIQNDDKVISQLFTNELHPMLNRAVRSSYQPGSTFKLITTATAFQDGFADANTSIYCGGVYRVGGKRCWTYKTGGHGPTNIFKAIPESCDIYFYELGNQMGIDKLVEGMKDFGLGAQTGIDLPGEDAGFVPDKAWRDRKASDPKNPRTWPLGDTLSAAIGQIVELTPLQLAQEVSWIANGGDKVKPHLVKQFLDSNGNVLQDVKPESSGTLKAAPGILATIREAMKGTPFGAGSAADGWFESFPMKIGAKTGTSENPPYDDYGTWLAFAPADNPQIAVAIVVEQAGHGGNLSPIGRAMIASYFKIPLKPNDPARVPDNWTNSAAAEAKGNHP